MPASTVGHGSAGFFGGAVFFGARTVAVATAFELVTVGLLRAVRRSSPDVARFAFGTADFAAVAAELDGAAPGDGCAATWACSPDVSVPLLAVANETAAAKPIAVTVPAIAPGIFKDRGGRGARCRPAITQPIRTNERISGISGSALLHYCKASARLRKENRGVIGL
ncbi:MULTISPECIES: hypothetical protein [Thermocrispum]|uniref:hypothetical protein n=1 Tax=Thermocrispum TaxID=37924 RepID=UPI00316AE710